MSGFCHCLPLSLGSISLTSFSPKAGVCSLLTNQTPRLQLSPEP